MELIAALAAGTGIGAFIAWIIQEMRGRARAAADSEQRARLEARLEQARSHEEMVEDARSRLATEFQAAAGQAVASNSENFITLANENFEKAMTQAKGELDERHARLETLIAPMAEQYGNLGPKLDQLDQSNQRAVAETARLTGALSGSHAAGHWGEMQLRRVVEIAGMTDYTDYAEQESVSGGTARPDMVIRLPHDRAVVIDAKASLQAHLDAGEDTAGDIDREAAVDAIWRRHAAAMSRQVDELAARNYGEIVEGSLNFVVMFVPGDHFLSAALRENPRLVEYAMGKGVAIATPASLMALLWTVANGWERERIGRDAEEIRLAGEEMHKRMQTFMGHYGRAGKAMEEALKAYNQSVRSFDSRVMPQGRRFAELGAWTEPEVPRILDGEREISRHAGGEEDRET